MRLIRNRAGFIAALAVTLQMVTIVAAYAVISCDQGPALGHAGMSGDEGMSGHEGMAGHEDMAGHEGMVDGPMQKNEPACPLHAEKHGTHDCDCPTLGCSQTDAGFAALFGAAGILPAAVSINGPLTLGDASPVIAASANRLASVPLAPPPRG